MPGRHGAQLTIRPGREPRKQPSPTGEHWQRPRTARETEQSQSLQPTPAELSLQPCPPAEQQHCGLDRAGSPASDPALWCSRAWSPTGPGSSEQRPRPPLMHTLQPRPPTGQNGRLHPAREPGQQLHSQWPPGLQSPAVALPNFRVQPVTPREGRPPRPHRSRSNGGAQPIALTFYGVQSAASPWYWIGPATLPDQKGLQSPASGPTWMQNR